MKIRLGILESDERYTMRLINFFNTHYFDKLEIFAFSSVEKMEGYLQQHRIDILIADPQIELDTAKIQNFVTLAYFSDTPDVDTINHVRTICKYQKAELIYKEILGIYAELNTWEMSYRRVNSGCPILTFVNGTGGAGATVVSAGCAMRMAFAGKKVMYLNLKESGLVASVFEAEGQFGLSDALYAVKSNRSNLNLKLESMMKKDNSGVYFLDDFKVMLDARDMLPPDQTILLKSVAGSGSYDAIVLCIDNRIDDKCKAALQESSAVVMVSDSTLEGNKKTLRRLEALKLDDEQLNNEIRKYLYVLYNKYGSAAVTAQTEVSVLGTIPRYQGVSSKQIAQEISKSNVFDPFISN